jgi:methionyl-tRNA formyltransferase
VTLAPKLRKEEARLDFSRPATALVRAVRAFNPTPGAFCEIAGERLKILSAEAVAGTLAQGEVGSGLTMGTADGVLRPRLVQRAGRPAMTPDELLRGWNPFA